MTERNSSRRSLRLASSKHLEELPYIPSPPHTFSQRGYYSDIVTKDIVAKEVIVATK